MTYIFVISPHYFADGDFPVQKKETPLPPVGKSADSADYTVYYIIGGVSAAVVIIVITACTALIVRRQRVSDVTPVVVLREVKTFRSAHKKYLRNLS